MAVEIDAIQSAKSIGWTDALLSRLAANSVGTPKLTIGGGGNSVPQLTFTPNSGTAVSLGMVNGGSQLLWYSGSFKLGSLANGVFLRSDGQFAFSASSEPDSTLDTILLRDAANTLALRNGANAQALNVYNTYTSGSVYERGFMRWVSNVLEIGTEHVGATHRAMSFYAEGGISHFIAGVRVLEARSDCIRSGIDNTHDIGQVARTWKDLYQSGFHSLKEMTAPAAPAANTVRIYAVDNGAGKTQLMALFATGAAQQIAIEP